MEQNLSVNPSFLFFEVISILWLPWSARGPRCTRSLVGTSKATWN